MARHRWHSQGEADLPLSAGWLSPQEAERLDRLRYPKRRREVQLGRWTAKTAVALLLGLPSDAATLASIVIRPAPTGAPRVFIGERAAGLAISMTDRAGWAVAMLADGAGPIGCDLELVEPRSDTFVSDYLTANEQAVVRGSAEPDLSANLIWSAKESALKVLETGLRRDTRSVEVELMGEGSLDGWNRLLVTAEEGGVFPGWWRRYGDFLLTSAAIRDLPPPVAAVDPPGLATALPVHSLL